MPKIMIDVPDETYQKILRDRHSRTLQLWESIIAGGTVQEEVQEKTDSKKTAAKPSACVSQEKLKRLICNITAEYDTETIHIDKLIDEIDNMETDISALDKVKSYIDRVRSSGMGKQKSLDFLEKFVESLLTDGSTEKEN